MANKIMTGIVVSAKANKTIVVRIDRRQRHPIYSKSYTLSKRYAVHDEKSEAQVGDKVTIVETRPISKTKSWRLKGITEHTPELSAGTEKPKRGKRSKSGDAS